MKYGVVKNGKILYKYAFKEDQSAALAKEKTAIALPLEETQGQGIVSFVLGANKITMQFKQYEKHTVSFDNLVFLDISAKAKEFLEKTLVGSMNTEKVNGVFRHSWLIGVQEKKKIRKAVWKKWDDYVSDFLASKATKNEENDDDGISMNDLILNSFLGTDWPIQGKTGRKALKNSDIVKIKGEMKTSLMQKRSKIETLCITDVQANEAQLAAIEAAASWVLEGVI